MIFTFSSYDDFSHQKPAQIFNEYLKRVHKELKRYNLVIFPMEKLIIKFN